MVAQGQNTLSFDDLRKLAVECGSEKGKGNDAQIRFALKVVEGAYFSCVDIEPDKHGKDKDDATVLAADYVKTQTGSEVFNKKKSNSAKLASCFKTLIRFGMWPHGGTGEPIGVMNKTMTIWRKERADSANAGLLDDAFNTLMKLARTQIRRDTLVEDSELRDLCFKRPTKQRSDEANLQAAAKLLEKVKKHKNSPHVNTALQQINAEIKAIAAEKAKTAAAQKAKTAAQKSAPAAQAAAATA